MTKNKETIKKEYEVLVMQREDLEQAMGDNPKALALIKKLKPSDLEYIAYKLGDALSEYFTDTIQILFDEYYLNKHEDN